MAKQASNAAAPATAPAAPLLGKYAGQYAKAPQVALTAPVNFTYANVPLYPAAPPKGAASVMGVLYAMLAGMPKGSTGGALVAKASAHNWAAHTRAAKYTKHGTVCGQWLAGYVNGLVRHGHATTKLPA